MVPQFFLKEQLGFASEMLGYEGAKFNCRVSRSLDKGEVREAHRLQNEEMASAQNECPGCLLL